MTRGKKEALPNGNLSVVRGGIQKEPTVEALLQQEMQVVSVGRTAPKTGSHPRWFWTMKDLDLLRLKAFEFGSWRHCTYCGDPPSQRDHVIAVSYQHTHKESRNSINGPTTWACGNCNGRLSNRYFESFKSRCEWANWRIDQKAAPIEWHQRDIKALDSTLRSHVESNVKKRMWMRQRADWYGSREFYLNLESLVWQVQELPPNTLGTKFLLSYFSSMLRDIVENIYRH